MLKLGLWLVLALSQAQAAWVETDFSVPIAVNGCLGTIALADLQQRVYSVGPEVPSVHFLYTHGFADHRKGNSALYEKLATEAGARVSAPELPFHGDSRGTWAQRLLPFKSLDLFSHLASQTGTVLDEIQDQDPTLRDVKVVRSGWSTGGLLGIYELVSEAHSAIAARYQGAVFFAPGVAVKPVFRVTASSLVEDPRLMTYPPVPRSPLLRPFFAAQLLLASRYVQSRNYPTQIPTLVFLGDDERDSYVNNEKSRLWFLAQIARGARVWVVNTPYKHGVGFQSDVQDLTARFVGSLANGDLEKVMGRGPGVADLSEYSVSN